MKQELRDARALRIMECAERGLTVDQTASELVLNPQTVRRYGKQYAVAFVRAGSGTTDAERLDAIVGMYKAGKTLEQIGGVFGVSRERIRQLLKKYAGMTAKDGGQTISADFNRKERRRREEEKYLSKYGCTPEQYREARQVAADARAAGTPSKAPLAAFCQQRHTANTRGITWNIKFWDWWAVWRESGKWQERGRRGDGYVMCRFKDDGPYEIGNVYIATLRHNSTVQPNNPYRKGHPDFEKTIAAKRERNGQAQRVCERVDCTGAHYAHGLCRRHYHQVRRSESASPAPEARAA